MLSPAAVLRSLRNISLFTNRRSEGPAQELSDDDDCLLHRLPVDVLLLILTFLSPRDLCRLGATCQYWSSMVRDPLLWKYFLIRDAAHWSSVDHLSTPRLHFLTEPAGGATETDTDTEIQKLDFMAEYLRCCPECRSPQRCTPPSALSSFLHSLVSETEPRFSMFGSGLEQLDVSLMTVMMNSPNVLRVAGIPQRQINSIGSGITFEYEGHPKFNIITLYSTNSAERARARVERTRVNSKVFVRYDDDDGSGRPRYSIAPQFQEVFRSVNGFIYVTNAETETAIREDEYAQISAVVQPMFGSPTRPLLVLSCVSRDGENQRRSACVSVAHQLQLHLLPNPWMVQDVVAESLSGLLEGVSWLLRLRV
ncbi:F-box only protein 4 isoform X1 [Tachysurus fulvidraco]|uniref:F-box only protein 4 isoform X1 n=1 Tax=Tachysurus fulvidraco TaxID=1234273 RepID=UPI001FED4BDA|nr:F-box only protein 4 isoform X1 [Tachysurus fulvidraco]XP_027026880.2 F-box only protein 4 isoform X1 [Tachysurus fulvidraco]